MRVEGMRGPHDPPVRGYSAAHVEPGMQVQPAYFVTGQVVWDPHDEEGSSVHAKADPEEAPQAYIVGHTIDTHRLEKDPHTAGDEDADEDCRVRERGWQ